MWNPKYFHVMMKNRAYMTVRGSASHGWYMSGCPTAVRALSTRPFGWSIRLQTIAVMTSAMTYGAKNTSRRTVRPRKRRLSISASPSANGIWMTSDSTTMSALCPTAPRNTWSVSARWKFARPTKSSSGPSPFQSYRLNRAACAIGNSTNSPYNAIAGSMNSAVAAHARRRRFGRVAVPTAVTKVVTQDGNGPATRPAHSLSLRARSYRLAAAWMAWTTDSGVPVPANRVATASLMAPPSSGVVAWSR